MPANGANFSQEQTMIALILTNTVAMTAGVLPLSSKRGRWLIISLISGCDY
jgi:hypothetical protein